MKAKLLIMLIGLILTGSIFSGGLSAQRFKTMSHAQIDSLLSVTATKNMTVTGRMQFYSEYFLNMPYNLVCAGDGPYALYETYPLVNFAETNCMLYCEHVLALAISDSWDNFFNNLQQIRYKEGMIGMRTRNHYTMADWLPQNMWLLSDASRAVGADQTMQVTRTISHQKFFAGKGITDMRYTLPDRTLTIDYIPKEALAGIAGNLRNGDIGALIFAGKEDIFSAHMWMVFYVNGQPVIRESSSSKMTTFDTPYSKWAEKIANSQRYIGISIMRIRPELDVPGKIILPWQIAGLHAEMDTQ